MRGKFIVIDPESDFKMLKGLASPDRIRILKYLHDNGSVNINLLSDQLEMPQSSVSSNVKMLEEAGLLTTEAQPAKKGIQKICHAIFDEIIVKFDGLESLRSSDDSVDVTMPIGLYSDFQVTAPCGLCSSDGVIGLLDVPTTFLEPERMKAALLWFTSGYVEYMFPNNLKITESEIESVEITMEVSSEVPGTDADWPSDITLSINGVEIGLWTSPGDFGDQRGRLTPRWWKLRGSQYGMLKTWSVNKDGAFVDGVKISDITIDQLNLLDHRSIRLRIAVKPDAANPGGLNIFGRGFGNYDQDILLRMKKRR